MDRKKIIDLLKVEFGEKAWAVHVTHADVWSDNGKISGLTFWYLTIKFTCGIQENYCVDLAALYPQVAAAEMKTTIRNKLKQLEASLDADA